MESTSMGAGVDVNSRWQELPEYTEGELACRGDSRDTYRVL